MTTANKLTVFRIIVLPIMVFLVYFDAFSKDQIVFGMSTGELLFAILFITAALTDLLDGYVARKYHQITTFGKFLDPIADKLLVFTAMLYLLDQAVIPMWSVLLILMREFVVTGVRLVAVDQGVVIPASIYGKIKTVLTMLALSVLVFKGFGFMMPIGLVIYYLAVIATILSGFDYVYGQRKIIFKSL